MIGGRIICTNIRGVPLAMLQILVERLMVVMWELLILLRLAILVHFDLARRVELASDWLTLGHV